MNFFKSVLFVNPESDSEEADRTTAQAQDEIAAAATAAAAATTDFFKSVFSTSPDENEPDEDEDEDEDEDRDRDQQKEPSDREQNQEEREIDEREEEEEGGTSGGWGLGLGGLIKTFSQDQNQNQNRGHDENQDEDQNQDQDQDQDQIDEQNQDERREISSSGGWGLGFGGLIKTFAHKSETVIRDLEEFGQGLKAETAVLRDVASKALDVGASAAQESLESMGQVVDDLGDTFRQGTAEIISQSKEALLSMDSPSSPSSNSDSNSVSNSNSSSRPILAHLTRFESQMLSARSDPATFADPPEDQSDFDTWRLNFKLEEMKEEIEGLLKDNSQLEVFLEKLVPGIVDYETFWSRYFYKVYKIKQAEDARAKIVNMAKNGDEDEDLSWDVEEEEEEIKHEERETEVQKEEVREKDKEVILINEQEVKGENNGDSNGSKSSEFSIVSNVHNEEEDLGWEAIDELNEEKEGVINSDSKVEDLRKRLSNVSGDKKEEEEELSWDIEDEDDVGPTTKT